MPIPCYLALTGAEFANTDTYPEKCGWMACHFSCYSTGLSNLPQSLPAGAMVIVNDRTPIYRHDPQQILEQLAALAARLKPDCFLLDFQRADVPLTSQVAALLSTQLPCPVGVTASYARDLDCPVLLEPPPLHMPLATYIAPWQGREIWLEIAPETMDYTVTPEGCRITESQMQVLPEPAFFEENACCRYHMAQEEAAVIFTLQRSDAELDALLTDAAALGISRAVGLYQQLKNFKKIVGSAD